MSGATSGAGIAYHARVHPHLFNAVLVIITQSLVFCKVLCVLSLFFFVLSVLHRFMTYDYLWYIQTSPYQNNYLFKIFQSFYLEIVWLGTVGNNIYLYIWFVSGLIQLFLSVTTSAVTMHSTYTLTFDIQHSPIVISNMNAQ